MHISTRLLLLWLSMLVGFLLTTTVFYPGFMNFDAAFQLSEVRTDTLTDLHPPVMAWIWGNLERIAPGPFPMLVFQAAMFWMGLGLLIAGSRRAWAPFIALVVGLLPPIWTSLGTIQKDTLMAAALLLAVGLLMQSHQSKHPLWAWFALLPFALAVAARHNAITALPPLLLWWAWLVLPKPRRWTVLGAGAVMTALLYLAASLFTRQLNAQPVYAGQQFMMHDLVAISIREEKVLLPYYVERFAENPDWVPYTLEDLDSMYEFGRTTPIFLAHPPSEKQIHYLTVPDLYNTLVTTWRQTVAQYPDSYLKHRGLVYSLMLGINPWEAYKYQRGLKPWEICVAYNYEHEGYSNPELGIEYTPSAWYQALIPHLEEMGESGWFRAGYYLIVAGVLFTITVIAQTGVAPLRRCAVAPLRRF